MQSESYINQTWDPESLQTDEKTARIIRHGFIRKVYLLLSAQLALTTVLAGAFSVNEAWRIWIITSGQPLVILSLVGTLVTMLAMACVPALTQTWPTNISVLGAFTVFESIAVSSICATVAARQGASVVLQALICTTLIVVGLTIFAIQTKYDWTAYSGVLFAVVLGFMLFGLLRLLFPYSKMVETIYATVGALIFSAYLVVDTQLLIGKKENAVDEDQYIMITLALYLDIINLFLHILRLISSSRDD